ncbi:MAG: ABC transporter permease [Gammaproteobacteria bacterium]|nr:ABC transporter permease [Gammaproteobacteria bacterium]
MSTESADMVTSHIKSLFAFIALLAVLVFIFSQLHDQFFTVRNFNMMSKHMSINAITALGLTFVIIVGHFDMSFQYVGCLAAMTTAYIVSLDATMASFMIGGIHSMIIVSVLVGIIVGTLWGALSGVAVGVFKLDDMVTTIGTGSIAFGLAYLYSNGSFIYKNFLMSGILEINDAKWFDVPFPALLMLITYLLAYMVLHRSRYGRNFYATGANKTAAVFSGVAVKKYIIVAFAICAGLTSLAAIISTASRGQGSVTVSINFLMPAYVSLYIGIAIFKKATVIGTFLGTLFTTILTTGFVLINVPFYIADLIVAITLVFAIVQSRIDLGKFIKKVFKTKSVSPGSIGGEAAS